MDLFFVADWFEYLIISKVQHKCTYNLTTNQFPYFIYIKTQYAHHFSLVLPRVNRSRNVILNIREPAQQLIIHLWSSGTNQIMRNVVIICYFRTKQMNSLPFQSLISKHTQDLFIFQERESRVTVYALCMFFLLNAI